MTVIDLPAVKGQLLVIGDTLIDETWYVGVKKLSPEAPIPVVSVLAKEPTRTPGGASLAAGYALRESYPITFMTSVDQPTQGWLNDKGMKVVNYPADGVISRVRFIDKASNYQLLRVDNDEVVGKRVVTVGEVAELLDQVTDISGVVLLDYNKGFLVDPKVCEYILEWSKMKFIPSYVDTRGDITKYAGFDVLKLNQSEYDHALATLHVDTPTQLGYRLNLKTLIITKGKLGAELFNFRLGTSFAFAPTMTHEGIPDVTGCGDVFDMNFCHYFMGHKYDHSTSLRCAVEKASAFAYEPLGVRLK